MLLIVRCAHRDLGVDGGLGEARCERLAVFGVWSREENIVLAGGPAEDPGGERTGERRGRLQGHGAGVGVVAHDTVRLVRSASLEPEVVDPGLNTGEIGAGAEED